MGWLHRLFAAGAGGADDDEPDPQSVVWVATVALWQAPLIVHALAEQRIEATFTESSMRPMSLGGGPGARIYVHQVHRADAERIVGDLIGGEPRDGSR